MMGDPNWQADMLKSPSGAWHLSPATQKHEFAGFLAGVANASDGGTNLHKRTYMSHSQRTNAA
jgi:hypothetical protein